MKKTKIEWCDCTINPVVGCKNGCPYCYARRINDRFHIIPKWDEPQFFPDRLKAFESKKPKSIFMDSMSDIEFWQPEWIDEVLLAIKKKPQHKYIFLTKNNALPYDFFYDKKFTASNNIYFGKSVTLNKQVAFTDSFNFDFLSVEPVLEKVSLDIRPNKMLKQIIIGAETGNRKGKVIPKKEWIDDLCAQADSAEIMVFMKDSLIPIVGEENMRRELIWR